MSEMRILIIGSLSGDEDSVIDEKLFPYDDDEEGSRMAAANQAAAWLHTLADGMAKAANS